MLNYQRKRCRAIAFAKPRHIFACRVMEHYHLKSIPAQVVLQTAM
jgi:hypothetical protein